MWTTKPLLGTKINWSHPLAKGLVVFWLMNEGTGNKVYDLSGNNYTGTLTNMAFPPTATSGWNPGRVGKCLTFDGSDDYVSIPDNNLLSFGNGTTDSPFSISLWAYFDSVADNYILSKGTLNTTNGEYVILLAGGTIYFILGDVSATAYIGRYYSGLSTGQWYHIVCTYDGSSTSAGIKIYVNNVRVDTTNYQSGTYVAMENGTADLKFGCRGDNTLFFNGIMDEPRLYNFELTVKNIDALYKNPAGTKKTFPVNSNQVMNITHQEAGEAVTANYVACSKCKVTDYYNIFTAQDYTEAAPDQVGYDVADRLYLNSGGAAGDIESVIKIDVTAIPLTANIFKAELHLYFYGVPTPVTITVQLILLTAAFNPATVTWNTRPTHEASGNNIEFKYGTPQTITVTANGWKTIDITQLCRYWRSAGLTNYGFLITTSSATTTPFFIMRYDHALYPMFLRVTDLYDTDGKVYHADADDYAKCRNILGVFMNSVSSGIVPIQMFGALNGTSYTKGGKCYLGEAGAITEQVTNNDNRAIKIADTLLTTVRVLDIQRTDIFIEKLAVNYLGGTYSTYGAIKIYPPNDARRALIVYRVSGDDDDPAIKGQLEIRSGQGEACSLTQQGYDNVVTNLGIIATWSSTNPPYITIDRSDTTVLYLTVDEVYFYN